MELCASARACGRTGGALGLGDYRVAVGISLLGGVSGITRTGPDVLGPRAHPNLNVAVGTGLGCLFALAGDLAVPALAGCACLGFREWNGRVLGVASAVTQRLTLPVVDVIDGAGGVLDVRVPEECCRRVFVVGFGSTLARGACVECYDFAECRELALGANVQRSGEPGLEEVFAQAECRAGKFLGGALTTVAAFDGERGGVFFASDVDRDLFAFSKDSVAGGALGVGVGEARAGEQLGTVGGDFGQHRSATSHSAAWKVSRWRSCSRMDSRLQASQRQ